MGDTFEVDITNTGTSSHEPASRGDTPDFGRRKTQAAEPLRLRPVPSAPGKTGMVEPTAQEALTLRHKRYFPR
jgi:hypothetical protein